MEGAWRKYGKYASQLWNIFWESIEYFITAPLERWTGNLSASFLSEKCAFYATAIYDNVRGSKHCIVFIDGKFMEVSRPSRFQSKPVIYNCPKRKHAILFQALTDSDRLILQSYGPIEGRKHDWTFYSRRNLKEQLPEYLTVDSTQYCIYGDRVYARIWFLEMPFQGRNLTAEPLACNKAISSARITVEWVFKDVKLFFSSVDRKRNLRLNQSCVGLLYLSALLLYNIRNFIYPSLILKYFESRPPYLEEYQSHKQ